jgi:hypothetical protein
MWALSHLSAKRYILQLKISRRYQRVDNVLVLFERDCWRLAQLYAGEYSYQSGRGNMAPANQALGGFGRAMLAFFVLATPARAEPVNGEVRSMQTLWSVPHFAMLGLARSSDGQIVLLAEDRLKKQALFVGANESGPGEKVLPSNASMSSTICVPTRTCATRSARTGHC